MKRLLSVLGIPCDFGLATASFVQRALTINEGSPVIQGTLMKIDGPFYVIMDSTGKEQRVHVDKSTLIIGQVQPGSQVKAEVTKDGHASALKEVGS